MVRKELTPRMSIPQDTKKVSFGLPNYWRMFRKRGIRLPIRYFLDNHLFDLVHGTDTHVWMPKDRYEPGLGNLEQGTFYMSSWTSEIRRVFSTVRTLADRFEDYSFLDIGCGKGKVVLVWEQLLRQAGLRQPVAGIDYYQPLLDIAEANHRRLFDDAGRFIRADATQVDYSAFGDKLIVYIFNPFGEVLMRQVLGRLKGVDVYLVYNNPAYPAAVTDSGFDAVAEWHGFHPNCQTVIYRRKPLKDRTEQGTQ